MEKTLYVQCCPHGSTQWEYLCVNGSTLNKAEANRYTPAQAAVTKALHESMYGSDLEYRIVSV